MTHAAVNAAHYVMYAIWRRMMTKLEEEDTIACWRCEEQTPMSGLMAVHAEWVCGVCYDDL